MCRKGRWLHYLASGGRGKVVFTSMAEKSNHLSGLCNLKKPNWFFLHVFAIPAMRSTKHFCWFVLLPLLSPSLAAATNAKSTTSEVQATSCDQNFNLFPSRLTITSRRTHPLVFTTPFSVCLTRLDSPVE